MLKLNAKDAALIKSALRRAFSRSELHKTALAASIRPHSDPSRPKVKTWCICAACGKLEAKSYMDVDHILPYVEIGKTFMDMEAEEMVTRLWCNASNLQVLCPKCHDEKSSIERSQRAAIRRASKPPKVKHPRRSAKRKSAP